MQVELGANAMLAVSIAACKAGAAEKEVLFFFLSPPKIIRVISLNVPIPLHFLVDRSLFVCRFHSTSI
jgi:enolase